MKHVLVLWYGLLFGFLFGFVVSMFQSYINHEAAEIAWLFLISGLAILIFKYLLNKIEEETILSKKETVLSRIESVFLVGNILIFLFSLGSVLVTFSERWLADNVRFPIIALGLSNLIAIIYWSAIRNKKPI